MAKKKQPLDPQMQELVDHALASGDSMGFIRELTQQVSGADPDAVFESNPEIKLPDPPTHPSLVTMRLDIVGARPPIWRRLELRSDLSLADVHEHLQAAFGWLNGHLHRFDAPGSSGGRAPYFITEFDAEEGETGTDERDARLDQVLRKPGEKLRYTYDFGDNWEHDLKVESVRPATDDDPAARCTGGRGACPPEDVGGIHTWNELAAALRADPDPRHLAGDLDQYADWLPVDCDPDEFSPAEANQSISLVGMSADQIMHVFGQAPVGALSPELPQPRAEFAELLGRCTNEVSDMIGQIAARAASLDEAVTDDDIRAELRPWRAVLDVVGDDGVQLTGAGWLPPAAVQRIREEGGIKLIVGKGNREQHTMEVRRLREECVRAGMLRKHKGQLLLTKRGRPCRDSSDELIAAIADSLARHKDDFTQDARVVSLLFIAADWQIGPDSRWAADAAARGDELRPWEIGEAFWDDVAHLLNDMGWRVDGKLPVHRNDLRYDERAAILTLASGAGLRRELPASPALRKIAKAALFQCGSSLRQRDANLESVTADGLGRSLALSKDLLDDKIVRGDWE